MFDDFQEMEEEGAGGFEPAIPEGLLAPRDSDFLLDHSEVEQTLLDIVNSGSIPHAFIFSGLKGIGKSTMAFRLARFLLKNGISDPNQDSLFGDAPSEAVSLDIDPADPVFSKVASGGHPDLLTIERPMDDKKGFKKNNLDVETARKVTPFLRMTSADGGWRVVIVDDADTMNRNAQNALLKILEEPPENTVLILISHRLGAMISTIRSRCRVVHFNPLQDENLQKLIQKEVGDTVSAYDQKILTALSSGSIGICRKIVESGGLETAQTVLGILKQWPNFEMSQVHHLADGAARAGQNEVMNNIERTFLFITEQIAFAKAKGLQTLPEPIDDAVFIKMLNERSLEHWITRHSEIKDHFASALFSNLDKKIAVINAFNLFRS